MAAGSQEGEEGPLDEAAQYEMEESEGIMNQMNREMVDAKIQLEAARTQGSTLTESLRIAEEKLADEREQHRKEYRLLEDQVQILRKRNNDLSWSNQELLQMRHNDDTYIELEDTRAMMKALKDLSEELYKKYTLQKVLTIAERRKRRLLQAVNCWQRADCLMMKKKLGQYLGQQSPSASFQGVPTSSSFPPLIPLTEKRTDQCLGQSPPSSPLQDQPTSSPFPPPVPLTPTNAEKGAHEGEEFSSSSLSCRKEKEGEGGEDLDLAGSQQPPSSPTPILGSSTIKKEKGWCHDLLEKSLMTLKQDLLGISKMVEEHRKERQQQDLAFLGELRDE